MIEKAKGQGDMKEIVLILSAYIVGNFLTAYFIGRIFYKQDVKSIGSGNPGARNVGRLFGKKAFIFTFLGDASKGAIMVLLAKWLDLSITIQFIVLLVVVLGHLYPIFFRFKGGKGLSTFIGGLLACQPLLFLAFVGLFLIYFIISRSLTLGGMTAIASLPFIMVFFSYDFTNILIVAVLSIFLIYSSRENIKEKLRK